MKALDSKMCQTDVADLETILRLAQLFPSKKAEPIKLWLAKVGNERIAEIADPEQSINRARKTMITKPSPTNRKMGRFLYAN